MISRKFIALIICFITQADCAVSIPQESKKLGYCEFVFFYAAQMAQMQNNEGLAKNYARRASFFTVANFLLIEENGNISAEKIKQFRAESILKKSEFDANQKLVAGEISKCDKDVTSIALTIRNKNKTMWGKNFDELQQEMFIQNLSTLGVR